MYDQDELACGPFVEVVSAYNSLNAQVRSISIVGYVSCRTFSTEDRTISALYSKVLYSVSNNRVDTWLANG